MSKALVTFVLLASVSGNAAAEWIKVTTAKDESVAYADPSTIRKNGDIVSMWVLMDSQTPEQLTDKRQYLSVRSQFEFDCKEQRKRTLVRFYYNEHVGQGDFFYKNASISPWTPAVPGTIAAAWWRYACKR